MPINKNHEFEELNGIKCAIVEKNIFLQRVDFLKNLLEFNGYTVVVVPSTPPKTTAPPKPATATNGDAQPTHQPLNESTLQHFNTSTSQQLNPPTLQPPETFTIGVTDVTFNPINAIFGRLLRTPDNHIVTLAYWQEKEKTSKDEVPYFESGI